ncbi:MULTISPECIES: WYL domain-containing protein [Spirulina sp. CCY15215]|uniref:WYL domain-containing protein n=1 Tax=Spirulina sp. CCY15215 TaxID=2767591 RepID=UPI00194FC018|nr:WYL domain-containing protein [Spirulina major]
MHHFLIGIPASGKSTFAQLLAQVIPDAAIISTDSIRKQLYGDETVQGNWSDIEAKVFQEIRAAVANGKTIIYDATNIKRHQRLNWLHSLGDLELAWLAWCLDPPVKTCKTRNCNRERRVPVNVIEDMATALKQFPPIAAEGLAMVSQVKPDADEQWLQGKLASVTQSQQQQWHRTANYQWHAYSGLLDCDRLLHLIALLLDNARENEEMLDSPEALCKVMEQKWGKLYGEADKIAQDLAWLQANGIIAGSTEGQWQLAEIPRNHAIAHAYSDRDVFLRVMETIRFMARHPFEREAGKSVQEALLEAMGQAGIYIPKSAIETLQKDIERVLKPYGILAGKPYRRGYYLGTGVFNASELNQIYNALQSFSQRSDAPEVTALFALAEQRLQQSRLLHEDTKYPLRMLGTKSIVDRDRLPGSSLARQPETIENAILAGELLELQRLPGSGKFNSDAPHFLAYPLQLVFHQIAWYLAIEVASREQKGLLRFERLDRLCLGYSQNRHRSSEEQYRALKKLHRLYDASAGLYLGNDPKVQQNFLQGEKAAATTVELWITSEKYRFIAEGTQRFPRQQLKLSKPPERSGINAKDKLFCLKDTGNKDFPHRLRVTLPVWSLDDIELQRWILGFAGHIKVIQPEPLQQKIAEMGEGIVGSRE